jgi:IMP dehydrogenase
MSQLFDGPEALTFDDVVLAPAFSECLPSEVNLETELVRGITLNAPIASAAMDTVTESRLAIALAQDGGIGFIHRNLAIERQARQVAAVKKYESGVIRNPITVTPQTTIRRVLEITRSENISGVPVVDGELLCGIVTHRDLRFEEALDRPVSAIMTPRERLVTVREGADTAEVIELLRRHRIEKVLVVDDHFALRGLITVKDIQKALDFPNASKDPDGRLRVGAAVGTGADTLERVAALSEAGADCIAIDTAHGHSSRVLEMVRTVKREWPGLLVVAGNVATGEGATALARAGADAVKVGVGPGSICTTRMVAGVGAPQLTAIWQASQALRGTDIPVIADGGIRYSGDISKAIAAGASAVMIGGLFAGTDEAPGEVELYQGRAYKTYRGMGSLGAMADGAKDRYGQEGVATEKLVPEGVEGRVPYRGSVSVIIRQLLGGLRAGMGYTGCATIAEMRTKVRFLRLTQAGVRESHVHDVHLIKEAPNYRLDLD